MKQVFSWSVYALISILLLGAVSSCKDDEPKPTPAPVETIELALDKVDFEQSGGNRIIDVKTSDNKWSVTSSQAWCKAVRVDKQIKITLTANEDPDSREAIVTIKLGTTTKTISIRQLGKNPALLVNATVIPVAKAGRTINFEVTSNVKYEIKAPSVEWIKKTEARAMTTKAYAYVVSENKNEDGRSSILEVVSLNKGRDGNPILKETLKVIQRGTKDYKTPNTDKLTTDIKVKVSSARASQEQGGQELSKSIDGDMSSLYHSPYYGQTRMPVKLNYYFSTPKDIDYLIYYPRSDGNSNGYFGKVTVKYTMGSSEGTLGKLMTYDFNESSGATKLIFPKRVKAGLIQIIVESGGNGFASCAEMEFYKYNNDKFKSEDLFTDKTCSELKDGITMADIDACKDTFYKEIATAMFNKSYEYEFRIAEFKAFLDPAIMASKNKINAYSYYDNPTGIRVYTGEDLVVFVGDTHNQALSLQVQGLYAKPDKSSEKEGYGYGGQSYPLSEGYNKVKIQKAGLVYVNYRVNSIDKLNSAKPIKIHFATGKVSGYFDSQNPLHKGRWKELLNNAKDECFDLVGKYAHLIMPVSEFKKYTPDGLELVNLYDKIVKSEMELLGLFKYDKVCRNRMMLNVAYHNYMYAVWGHTAYSYGTLPSVLSTTELKNGQVWGPAHEMGHMNQTRPGVKWIGMTEVTNNIMSEYIQTSIFNTRSRLQCEDVWNGRNRYCRAWNAIMPNKLPFCLLSIDPVKEATKIPAQYRGKTLKDVFCQLVPFWQLELYFGKVLGDTPQNNADKGGFYPRVYEWARENDFFGNRPQGDQDGVYQTSFPYVASKAAGYDLTEFFEKWGFLREMPETEIDDYAKVKIYIPASRIKEVKDAIAALNLPKLKLPIEYITDANYLTFKRKKKLTKGADASRNGNKIVVPRWFNVIAYEIWNRPYGTKDAKLLYISDGKIYQNYSLKSGFDAQLLDAPWHGTYHLYAVQYDGERIEVTVH